MNNIVGYSPVFGKVYLQVSVNYDNIGFAKGKIRLKVLYSEMDPAEIRLIQYVIIKERGVEVFWKNMPAPHPLRAL